MKDEDMIKKEGERERWQEREREILNEKKWNEKKKYIYLAWLKPHIKQWMYVLNLLSETEGLQSQVFIPQG